MSANTVVAQHVTKNDLYAQLVRIGIEKGYVVIPEFRVRLPDHPRKKTIDLVWVTRKPKMTSQHQDRESLDYWTLHATFEIEACDVRNIPGKEFNRHINDLPKVKNTRPAKAVRHFIVLYTSAYDRAWNNARKTTDDEIKQRRRWAVKSGVKVVDGRDLRAIHSFRQVASRSV